MKSNSNYDFQISLILHGIEFIRTLLINGLSFECTGDNDYDTSSSNDRKVPRKIRVRPKTQKSQNRQEEENEKIEVIKASNPDAIRKNSRVPSKTRRIKAKAKSSVKTSTSVSYSTSSSSDDDDENEKKLSIPKLGGERGIFAKWPKKVYTRSNGLINLC